MGRILKSKTKKKIVEDANQAKTAEPAEPEGRTAEPAPPEGRTVRNARGPFYRLDPNEVREESEAMEARLKEEKELDELSEFLANAGGGKRKKSKKNKTKRKSTSKKSIKRKSTRRKSIKKSTRRKSKRLSRRR